MRRFQCRSPNVDSLKEFCSATETGVCPNSSRNFFDGFLLTLSNRTAVDHDVVVVVDAVDAN
jgi:hypothetical protein